MAIAATLLGASTIPAQADAGERRSGAVVAVDRVDDGAVVVLRVGPWRIKDEDVVPGNVPLLVKVDSSTEVWVLSRPVTPGDVVATAADADAVEPGMYATVTFSVQGTDLVADRIDVTSDPGVFPKGRPSAPIGLIVQPK